jgi:uncharacterized protein YndB with AHSA1/START domain
VWAVLSNGWGYADWVVGAARIRAVEGRWPEPGARIHHTVGGWPGEVHDETEVLAYEPGHRLVLQARLGPAGEARVEISVSPLPEGGCEVAIAEDVAGGPGRLVLGPARRFALDVRNVEVLRRLTEIAER